MNVKIALIFLLFIVLSACHDNSTNQDTSSSDEQSDEDIAVLQPYLDDPALETRSNGVRKLGLYSETNDTGTFKDCNTGKSYTINIDNNIHTIHSTYTLLSRNQGQPLLVELIGEVQTTKDDIEVLQPKKLLGVIHKQSCN